MNNHIKILITTKQQTMKKRNLFLIALAAIGFAAATSCSNEEANIEVYEGKNMTFTVRLPLAEDMRTKASEEDEIDYNAIGTGERISELKCYVYNKSRGENADPISTIDIPITNADGIKGGTVSIKLPVNHSFDIVFVANSSWNRGVYDSKTRQLSDTYRNREMNLEGIDMFYAVLKDVTTETTTSEVVMKRPLAQINLGTSDLDDYCAYSGSPFFGASIEMPVFYLFDVMTGEPCGEPVDRTFECNEDWKDGVSEWDFPVDGYKHLGMVYVFAGTESSNSNIKVKYIPRYSADTNSIVVNYEDVPIQQNYQTNIFGDLLTKTKSYDISINPSFDGNKEKK